MVASDNTRNGALESSIPTASLASILCREELHDRQRRLSEEARDKVRSQLAHVARVMSLGPLTVLIAHEPNQPLSGIIANASTCLPMLSADSMLVDGARETTRRPIRDGNRASDVITRLRALFGTKEVSTELADLNAAARDVMTLSLSELQRSRVVLRTNLGDELPAATGDRAQLQEAILKLPLNASEAMDSIEDRPRQMDVTTEREADAHVRLTVMDVGAGFDPQTASSMFDAFYTTKRSSMGMGLPVSRSIIESHHGRIWATPNAGPGASFSFSIPCAPESETVFSVGSVHSPSQAGMAQSGANP